MGENLFKKQPNFLFQMSGSSQRSESPCNDPGNGHTLDQLHKLVSDQDIECRHTTANVDVGPIAPPLRVESNSDSSKRRSSASITANIPTVRPFLGPPHIGSVLWSPSGLPMLDKLPPLAQPRPPHAKLPHRPVQKGKCAPTASNVVPGCNAAPSVQKDPVAIEVAEEADQSLPIQTSTS